ncbi:MAG: sigma-70 family RNA polymerase sigma factor [Planctomycetes bacterium]|nr:sigma-70 family RNA polymerase sigma factor [Planctomycetota bacterium]
MKDYKHQALKELADQQVRFAPPTRRLEQLKRAEQLLIELDPAKSYPYQFVCYRVTDFRSELHPNLLVPGVELIHDLGLFINELAVSLPAVPIEEVSEPVLTINEISKKYNVTPKTIQRWRKRGLIGIPIVCNGHRQLGFLPSLVDPFLIANKDRIEKSSKFTLLTQEEKDDILRRARRFARFGVGSLTEVSRRIARRVGRSPETVRYTIKNFDLEHPEQALFPDVTDPLDADDKLLIYDSYQKGMDVDTLAKNFQRNRTSMYRVLSEVHAQRLLEHPIEFIHHASFDDPAQVDAILAPMPNAEAFEASRKKMRVPKDAPPELVSNYEMPLLTKDQEQHLFRKMNFLKYRAHTMLHEMLLPSGSINYAKLRVEKLDQIEASLKEANEVKDLLIRCNMRLVTSIAKRHSGQIENFFELLSDGNISLMRAVEKFDYSRGNKFSTYASWAIMKNFARTIPDEKNRKERFVTGNEEVFDVAEDKRSQEGEVVAAAAQATAKVNDLLEHLDPREREIIRMRAGLENGTEGMTLEKIGEKLGITKERVRQINVRAMKKLRTIVETQKEEA